MLKETIINDKNNTKVILNLYQGHFKVTIAKKSENTNFFISVQQCETSAWAKYLFAEYVSDNTVIAGTDFRRQNLTSKVGARIQRVNNL